MILNANDAKKFRKERKSREIIKGISFFFNNNKKKWI